MDGAALAQAGERLIEAGQLVDAIEAYSAANRICHSAELDERLVRLRYDAALTIPRDPSPDWPPDVADLWPELHNELPEIDAEALTGEVIASAFAHHGCLIVRDLTDQEHCDELIADIDQSFVGYDQPGKDNPRVPVPPSYVPFIPPAPHAKIGVLRTYLRSIDCMWLVDSPPATWHVTELFTDTGLRSVIQEYLGEQPVFSMNKATLRRLPPTTPADWHQDGSFMGTGVRAVNLWLALSDCGGESDAPGVRVIPRRFTDIMPTGRPDALTTASVHLDDVPDLASTPPVDPPFRAGDALLFDEYLLHCSGTSPNHTRTRYALECWCFAGSTYPANHAPLVI